ncbi:MAG: DUF3887 domain-containing protein [Lachnospiraceae bacterium]|jgi:uncharacterized membrane protein|nr:DUF3887 domain-containing protein [Lachnospiraceae bacterium]HBV81571.1 DUF3887 domain-containing protein [Lachnospiraceae bacterium]
MRKKRVIMIAMLCMMLLILTACSAQPLPEQFEEDTVKESAEQAIGFFNEQDYQSILGMSSAEFQEILTVDEFANQCDPYLEKCGSFKEISKTIFLGDVDKETQAAYGGVVMIGSYEEGTIQFTISFNEDMELTQFIIK